MADKKSVLDGINFDYNDFGAWVAGTPVAIIGIAASAAHWVWGNIVSRQCSIVLENKSGDTVELLTTDDGNPPAGALGFDMFHQTYLTIDISAIAQQTIWVVAAGAGVTNIIFALGTGSSS